MKRITRLIGAAAAGLVLAGAAQIPAQAAGAGASESVPACVTAKPWLLIVVGVEITNGCSTTQQVKVEYSRGGRPFVPDECHVLAPGEKVSTSEPFFRADRYVGLLPC
nr:hypothetical protein SBE_004663 [Streptomyces sp. SBE_14.2]